MKYLERESRHSFIRQYWHFSIEIDKEHTEFPLVPDSSTNIAFHKNPNAHLEWVRATGPFTKTVSIPIFNQSEYFGVRLLPGEWTAMFGRPAEDMVNQNFGVEEVPELRDIFPLANTLSVDNFVERFDNYFSKFEQVTQDEREVERKMVRMIIAEKGYISNDMLVDEIGLSERQLQRKFKAFTGISIKEMRSMEQLKKAFHDLVINSESIVDAALINNYFDQQHFSSKVKLLMNSTPKKVKEYLTKMQHDNLIP